SVPEIFYQLIVFHGEYNNVLIPSVFALWSEKLRSCTEELGRKSEKMLRSHAKLPCVILRRHLLIHLCFTIRAHAAFNVMFAAVAFIEEDNVFERTKHWTNIYALMVLNNNTENF
ncbi:hypothetical protein HZS_4760, partial [Henneguya salminicola]